MQSLAPSYQQSKQASVNLSKSLQQTITINLHAHQNLSAQNSNYITQYQEKENTHYQAISSEKEELNYIRKIQKYSSIDQQQFNEEYSQMYMSGAPKRNYNYAFEYIYQSTMKQYEKQSQQIAQYIRKFQNEKIKSKQGVQNGEKLGGQVNRQRQKRHQSSDQEEDHRQKTEQQFRKKDHLNFGNKGKNQINTIANIALQKFNQEYYEIRYQRRYIGKRKFQKIGDPDSQTFQQDISFLSYFMNNRYNISRQMKENKKIIQKNRGNYLLAFNQIIRYVKKKLNMLQQSHLIKIESGVYYAL